MISLKDYAKQKNISYEAVRQQINRYQDEIGEHIHKVGRAKFLDDEAVAFLDERRKKNPVVVLKMDQEEKITQLENENKALLLMVAELQQALLDEKDQVKVLQQEKIELLENQAKPRWKFLWRNK